MNLLSFVNVFLLFTCFAAALVSARSLVDVIGDAMQNERQQIAHPENVADSVEASRIKRHAWSECPVRRDSPVIVNGTETYLGFDKNETRPAFFPEENLNLTDTSSWWPKEEQHLNGLCPWKRVTKNMTRDYPYWELYPKYIQSVQCICKRCITAESFTCQKIQRQFTFYKKTGCQGNIPVLQAGKLPIDVGCYCKGERMLD